MDNEKTKRCSGCKLRRAVADFHKNRSRPDGLSDYCKSCSREARSRSLSHGRSEAASNPKLLNEALDSCLKMLGEIEEKIFKEKANAEAVKAVIRDLAKANGLKAMKYYKELPHGSFRYCNRKLMIRLK